MEIYIGIDKGWLVVENAVQPKKGGDSSGVGLQNLSNRCRLMLGKEIVIEKEENKFIVKVPLLYE